MTMTNELAVTYAADGEDLTVTATDVRNVLGAPSATDQEVRMFLELCKAQSLNPFIKEAYIIKYGNKPATLVVGKDVFTKRAQKNPKFEGYQAGLTLITPNSEIVRREGSMILGGEYLAGAWCKVYVKGYQHPVYEEVSYQEYVALKSDGTPNQQWSNKPGTMLRKVALVHALREAFPDDFQGMYDEAEMGNLETPVQVTATATIPIYEEAPAAEPELVVDGEWEEF